MRRLTPIRKAMFAFAVVMGCVMFMTGFLDRTPPPAPDQFKCAENGGVDPFTQERFDPGSIDRLNAKARLKIIEFTDEGELVDRCQWSDVIYEVRGTPRESKLQRKTASERDLPKERTAKLVVMYVHGWKHNADIHDEDLSDFKDLIDQLNKLEAPRVKPRDVVGIYIAWPGKTLNIPMMDNLSFWGRKGGADRVTAAGNISKLVSSIKGVSCQQGDPNDFIVGIGHSFGARILYTAVAPLLISELAMKHPGDQFNSYDNVTGVIDLTVLLNPAFEASRYTALAASRRNKEVFSASQQPLLLTVATSNDLATRLAFPIGQIMGTRWRERERTTLGNYQPYRTHELSRRSVQAGPIAGFWYDSFCQSGICLEKKDAISSYPFVVASTDATVLYGHNGIWKEGFISWLANFIEISSEKRLVDKNSGTGCLNRQGKIE
ncbi:hypothetical protein [Pseudomonas sp. RIT-PI-q]|uniref:hypothetical protein n=1 Tax=Pseudomonas sp. RIT-PI-q TaxID=1690247 RepID=UPI000B2D8DCA|nr:hypothetical protein [Pseudomonas sp. RIT-PI-q]